MARRAIDLGYVMFGTRTAPTDRQRFTQPPSSPPEMDMAALGLVAAARLESLKDSPRAVKRCASRRARELDMIDEAGSAAGMASRILLHECSVCGMCSAG